jgi:signal transduction histidine kinase
MAGIAAWFARDPAPSVVPVTVGAVWLLCWAFAYQQARARDGAVRQREHRQGEAVREERERIARELHDVVGHALSLMLVQIGAARTVLHEQPDTTRDLLRTAEKVGAETMVELDRVLGLLRTDTDAPRGTGTATQTDLDGTRPGLADLDRLVDRLGEAGLQVRLERDPGLEHLRPSTSLAVYRIAQESLTNALRHGHAVGARVVLGRHGDHLRLEVVDDGTGPPPGWVPGRGLIGVRERVQVLEGTVEHGPAPGGGFRVAVQLPLEPGA